MMYDKYEMLFKHSILYSRKVWGGFYFGDLANFLRIVRLKTHEFKFDTCTCTCMPMTLGFRIAKFNAHQLYSISGTRMSHYCAW